MALLGVATDAGNGRSGQRSLSIHEGPGAYRPGPSSSILAATSSLLLRRCYFVVATSSLLLRRCYFVVATSSSPSTRQCIEHRGPPTDVPLHLRLGQFRMRQDKLALLRPPRCQLDS